MDLYEEQLLLEQEAREIKERKEYLDLTQAVTQGRFDETKYGSSLMKAYFSPIKDKIQEYLDTEYNGHTGKTQRYIKYICDDSSKIAYIILQSLVKKLAQRNNNVKTTNMASYIISRLQVNHKFDRAVENNPKLIAYLGNEYRRASAARKQNLIEKHLEEEDDWEDSSNSQKVRAGAVLLEIVILSGVNLIEQRKTWDRKKDRYATLNISFTKEVFDILQSTYYIHPTVALYPPMIVEPKDWTEFKQGGYYSVPFEFMKLKSKAAKIQLQHLDYSKPMGVINKLQKTAWRVNTKVHTIIDYVYKHNLIDPRSPPTLPTLYGEIPTSNITDIKDILPPIEYIENPTLEEKKRWAVWNKQREQVQINLDGEQGRRLQYLMTMGVANKMLKYDRFYYAYQLDYRGRVYPITDFFNPQSKGYVKAMLEFADGQYLNDTGVYWLKVHIANTYGLDKEPFSNRVKWVEDNRLKLLKVASDPLSYLSDWVYTDSPYEFLAGCFAYQDYVQGKEVHLPIQLDAVNSGIQMYSGLLRDKSGAKSTCVIGNTRSDLYAEVANRVEDKLSTNKFPSFISFIDKEGKERVVTTKEEALSMKGNFTRSMTKKNVMTVPYSVSMRGMTMQNWDTMNEMKLKGKHFWTGDEWVVNKLWTELTHESIYEIVQGARAGQEYLKEVARLLKEPALWYTPIYSLPVLQPALKNRENRVSTVLGTLVIIEYTDELKRQKQLSSIAANYIHSIDATILMYIVDNSTSSIGTIHDCFLVHPNQGEEVRNLYKEGYVEVMKSDPLRKFSEELDPEGNVEIPYVGDLELDDVYDSEYIIS